MKRGAVLSSILSLLALTLLLPARSRAAPDVPTSSNVYQGAALASSTAAWTRVIVSLREPAALRARGTLDRPALKRQVSDVQQRVLAKLRVDDFQLIYQYEGVSGVAGLVSATGLSKLTADTDVLAVTSDSMGTSADAESLPLIRGDVAQGLGYSGAGVTVAVIDSGVDVSHPDLSDDIVVQECFQQGGGCPVTGTSRASGLGAAQDDQGHGTNVTGIITSKGTITPIGVAPNVKIAAYKAINSSDIGFLSDWIAALSDILVHHPEVKFVNMSLQSFDNYVGSCDNVQPALAGAISALRAAGTLTFAAAGNHDLKHGMTYPGCISSAVAVGAVYDASFGSVTFLGCTDPVTNVDRVTCFSNSDSTLDLLGPGAFITSTGLGGGTSTFGGTSQATPHAVGVAAMLLEANPAMTADQIEFRLKATGVGRTDAANGRTTPRIDAANALNPVDTDGDAIPDAYENWHPCLNPVVSDAAGDPDADGISTISEFNDGLDPCAADTDVDSCPDARETAAAHTTGGQRDPRNPWDFFDVPAPALLPSNTTGARNKAVSINDVIAILPYIGTNAANPNTPNPNGATYGSDLNGNGVPDGQEYDRAPSTTVGQPWRTNPPNGAVQINDAIVALNSIGDNCN